CFRPPRREANPQAPILPTDSGACESVFTPAKCLIQATPVLTLSSPLRQSFGVSPMHAFLVPLLLFLLTTRAAADDAKADLVLVNGKVWTVNKAQPEAEAVAIWRDRILAVGSTADIRKLAGDKTKVIDLNGRRVVPGFYDSHVHLLGSGM